MSVLSQEEEQYECFNMCVYIYNIIIIQFGMIEVVESKYRYDDTTGCLNLVPVLHGTGRYLYCGTYLVNMK
jgi:hypothetical protein